MKSVYETSTSLEAHMVKNLLTNTGIDAEVFGDHLEGGTGELAPTNLMRMMVNETQFSEAKQVIKEWEAS